MSTVTKSIGTSGRDYSTITAWEADLDNAAVYASGNHAVGECYNDSVFNESVTINGGGTVGLASVTLTVADGERHDGTAGTGARITNTGLSSLISLNREGKISWLDCDKNGNTNGNGQFVVAFRGAAYAANGVISNLLVHGVSISNNFPGGGIITQQNTNGNTSSVHNNIIYSIINSYVGDRPNIGLDIRDLARTRTAYNNTIYNISRTNGTGTSECAGCKTASQAVKNVVVTEIINGSCFVGDSGSSNNASSDATASGDGSLTNIVTADQYVSTVVGAEDLHLKAGSVCIDAGTDLGTTPTGVNIDIDGRDRDAEGDVWDIGADEWVATVARFPWQVRRERRMAGAR